MTSVRIGVVAAFVAVASACTPCLGVIDCEGTPERRLSGQVLNGPDGAAAANVEIQWVVRYPSATDSVATITDRRGLYEIGLPPRPETPTQMELRVRPPGLPGYTIAAVGCIAVRVRGDGCVLGPILRAPRLSRVLQFRLRGADGPPLANVRVTFQQTGGSQVLGSPAPARFSGITDPAGNLQFFGEMELYATSMEPMVGDLTIELPSSIGAVTTPGFAIVPRYFFTDRGISEVTVSDEGIALEPPA